MAKATKIEALGRGLSSNLNKDSNSDNPLDFKKKKSTIDNIDINLIAVNPYQPRSNFNEETLKELSASIKNIGVIQPITVRKIKENSYQLISGGRRLMACKNLGFKNIPAYIRSANDQESLEMALIENIHRQDLDAIEINIENKLDQIKVYEIIISKNLSVRNTEKLVKNYKNYQAIKKSIDKPKYISDAITKLSEIFKTSVRINVLKNNKGKIIIPFKSEAEFKKINKKLNDS